MKHLFAADVIGGVTLRKAKRRPSENLTEKKKKKFVPGLTLVKKRKKGGKTF